MNSPGRTVMKKLMRFLLIGVVVAGFNSISWTQSQTVSNSAAPDKNITQLKNLLERAGERIQKYQDAMFNIAFTEVLRQQELQSDGTPKNKPKVFVYDSVVLSSRAPANQQNQFPLITRTLKSIDGKLIEQKKLPQRSKCVETNPQPEYADPLTFLLPKYQTGFIFSYAGEAELEGRKTGVIIVNEPVVSDPVTIVETGECFRLSRNLRRQGKIWIDLTTFDVIQLQWQLAETFNGKLIKGGKEISYENEETTIRFRPVMFQNPEQVLLLPLSSESSWILKGAKIAGFRENIGYTRYRRFQTSVDIKDTDEDKN
jgi:hypothetical protein